LGEASWRWPALPARTPGRQVGAWRLAMVPLLAGAGIRVLVVACIQVLHGNFLFLDDRSYDRIGWFLAQSWHRHRYPPLETVTGTSSDLYYVFVAAVYYVCGHRWLVVKLADAVASALSVPAAAAIGIRIGGRRLGWAAAWLTALYPSAVFWGATGLKDGPMATMALAIAAIALWPLTIRRLGCAVVLIVVTFLCRPVEGVMGLAMMAVPTAAFVRSRWPSPDGAGRTWPRALILLAGIAAALVAVSVLAAERYLPRVSVSLARHAAPTLANGAISISLLPTPLAIVHALVSPVRWFGPPADAAYGALVPGAVVWLLLLPASGIGCWMLLRRGSWACRGVLVSVFVYLYLYTCVFQGEGFSRQRYTVEILLLIAGLYAFGRVPRIAVLSTAISACAIGCAQLITTRVLRPADVAAAAAMAGVLWLAASRAGAARRWRGARGQRAAGTRVSGAGAGRDG
jgi:hypothetical protein